MTTCATWSQPDGNHFRGLCRNEFRRETNPGIVGSSCPICVTPAPPFPTCDTQPADRYICRQYDGTPILPGGIRPDQFIDTWVPFYKVNIVLNEVYRPGPPWYIDATPNCNEFYIGEFTLGTVGGRCGSWQTFLTDPDEQYSKTVSGTAGCPDYTPLPRMQLFWSETNPTLVTNPIMTLRIHYRISSTNYAINCRYTSAPTSPLFHDCRKPLSFQTWQNTGGAWNGVTTFRPISESVGASVTLTPLYL